jgi:hypothetical protein
MSKLNQANFRLIIVLMLLFPEYSSGQSTQQDTLTDLDLFFNIDTLLKSSETINDTTFNVKFSLRVLPDNWWFLQLKKDGTFEYVHWSGWGPPYTPINWNCNQRMQIAI